MTQKKKALGRGLDAILVDNREQTDADGGITMVRISDANRIPINREKHSIPLSWKRSPNPSHNTA